MASKYCKCENDSCCRKRGTQARLGARHASLREWHARGRHQYAYACEHVESTHGIGGPTNITYVRFVSVAIPSVIVPSRLHCDRLRLLKP